MLTKRRLIVLCVLAFVSTAWRSASAEDHNRVSLHQLEGKIRVEIEGNLFTEYLYENPSKPILYPIIGPHDIGMTRNYPMKKNVPGEEEDHPHHQSMWFNFGKVNDIDFWMVGENAGRVVHDRFTRLESGSDRAVIQATNKWMDSDGKEVCSDLTTLAFSVLPAGRVIDWETTIQASQGELHFGDTKEGMMAIRTHPQLRLLNVIVHWSPDLVKQAKNDPNAVVGKAINSEGIEGLDVWGKRAKWVDFCGQVDGKMVGIAFMDHPSNLRHPAWWHAREYGLVAANPFGIHDFEEDKPAGAGDVTISAGDSLTFRYRFVFHDGDYEQVKIADLYHQYEKTSTDEMAHHSLAK